MAQEIAKERDDYEEQSLKPAQEQDGTNDASKSYQQEKRLETIKPFEDAERQNGLKVNDSAEKVNEGRGADKDTSLSYQHEKRLDGRKSVEDLDLEVKETRDKKAEIVENMVSRDFPINTEKNADNTRDFHYRDEGSFEKELKQRDSSTTERDAKLTDGFHDSRDNQAFVKENSDTLRTSIHEKLHQKSMSEMPTRFNEGLTEHFSRQEEGALGRLKDIDNRGKEMPKALSDYEREVEIVKKLESTIGREPLERAYFNGETDVLKSSTDGVLGDGSFQKISNALERGDYDAASKIIDNYYKQ